MQRDKRGVSLCDKTLEHEMEGNTFSKDAHQKTGEKSTKHEKLCAISEILKDFETAFG